MSKFPILFLMVLCIAVCIHNMKRARQGALDCEKQGFYDLCNKYRNIINFDIVFICIALAAILLIVIL